MDNLISSLLTFNFVIFTLGLAAITYVLRKIIEFFWLDNKSLPGSKTSKFWTELFLPISPVANGLIIGLITSGFPFPEELANATSGRVFYGLVAGLFSGLVYKIIKGLLKEKAAAVTLAVKNTTTEPTPTSNEEVVSDKENV